MPKDIQRVIEELRRRARRCWRVVEESGNRKDLAALLRLVRRLGEVRRWRPA